MKLTKSKAGGVLVFAGTAIMGTAYTPAPKPKPSNEFITTHYIRPTRIQRWEASEKRKEEILSTLKVLRKDIRTKIEKYKLDKNTVIAGITATQKLAIHSTKLMSDIANSKNIL